MRGLLIVIAMMACAAPVLATPHAVVGDSLSSPDQGPLTNPPGTPQPVEWPLIAFGEGNVTNHAVGGWTSYNFVSLCVDDPSGCWANTGDASTTWWILIGHNDWPIAVALGGLPNGYDLRLVQLADQIEAATGATEIRLITGPYVNPFWQNQWPDAWIDEMAAFDQAVCAADPRFTCVLDLRPEIVESDRRDGVHFNQAGHLKVATLLVPEPGSRVLAASGLLALGLISNRRASWKSRR